MFGYSCKCFFQKSSKFLFCIDFISRLRVFFLLKKKANKYYKRNLKHLEVYSLYYVLCEAKIKIKSLFFYVKFNTQIDVYFCYVKYKTQTKSVPSGSFFFLLF